MLQGNKLKYRLEKYYSYMFLVWSLSGWGKNKGLPQIFDKYPWMLSSSACHLKIQCFGYCWSLIDDNNNGLDEKWRILALMRTLLRGRENIFDGRTIFNQAAVGNHPRFPSDKEIKWRRPFISCEDWTWRLEWINESAPLPLLRLFLLVINSFA